MKLGLMKQFVKALLNEDNCFKHLSLTFSSLSIDKTKLSVFDGSRIQMFIKDKYFIGAMSKREKNAWLSLKDFVKIFLGNTQAKNFIKIVHKLLESFKTISCKLNIKLHFLHNHFANFQDDIGL